MAIKKIAIITSITIAIIILLILILVYSAFPLMSYLSRVRNPSAAKKAGEKIKNLRDATVVAVVGHPDDAEFYAGGLLAHLVRNNNRVVLVVGTSGEKGGNLKNLAETREEEQQMAGKIIGYDRIVFTRNPDRGLKNNAHFREQLTDIFKEENPSVLITFDDDSPAVGYRHSDHLAAGAASLQVANDFPSVQKAYLFSSASPNVLVEIAPYIELKMQGRQAHKSQSNANIWTRKLFSIFFRRRATIRDNRNMFSNPYPEVGVRNGELYRLVALKSKK